MAGTIDQLIVNGPYAEPERHWRYDRESRTFSLEPGRRPAGYVVATPGSKSFDDPGVFVPLPLVNRIRPRVEAWREAGYPGVTGTTLRLLQHWRDPETFEARRFFFCQLEAVETLIWLTEAPAGERQGIEVPGDGGPFTRLCAKMATGSGKTLVMGMVIAWHVLNRVANPQDPRFSGCARPSSSRRSRSCPVRFGRVAARPAVARPAVARPACPAWPHPLCSAGRRPGPDGARRPAMTPHARIALTLALVLLTAVPVVWAGDKEDVAAAGAEWAKVFVDDNPEPILALYAKDAVLWGTLSPTRRETPEALREYFVNAFKALPGHTVAFGDQLIRVYGDTAINTGYYTFSYVKDGQARSIPARYSFVYVKQDGKWRIVDHHSSAVPAPAR
jgi:uncharacterized protein (TIGR02246 family)